MSLSWKQTEQNLDLFWDDSHEIQGQGRKKEM